MAEEPMTIFQETSILYIDADDAFPKASFHSFELVSMIHNASEPESRWPAVVLMAAKEMLKFGCKLGQGLKAVGRGTPTLIEISDNNGGFDLGYELIHIELCQASRGKKRKCASPKMFVPHIRATFPTLAEVIMPKPFKELQDEEFDLACIIQLCPKEFSVNAIIFPEDNSTSTS